jgi:hypothetical protein
MDDGMCVFARVYMYTRVQTHTKKSQNMQKNQLRNPIKMTLTMKRLKLGGYYLNRKNLKPYSYII